MKTPGSLRVRRCCVWSGPLLGLTLVLGVGLEHDVSYAVLRLRVNNRSQERKASALPVDGVLTGRIATSPAVAAPALPDRESDELQSFKGSLREMQFAFANLPGGLPLSLGTNLTVMGDPTVDSQLTDDDGLDGPDGFEVGHHLSTRRDLARDDGCRPEAARASVRPGSVTSTRKWTIIQPRDPPAVTAHV